MHDEVQDRGLRRLQNDLEPCIHKPKRHQRAPTACPPFPPSSPSPDRWDPPCSATAQPPRVRAPRPHEGVSDPISNPHVSGIRVSKTPWSSVAMTRGNQKRRDLTEWALLSPERNQTSSGVRIDTDNLTTEQCLADFSCGHGIKFDSTLPVFVSATWRSSRVEEKFGSSVDVDDFVYALPVKEMFDTCRDLLGGDEYVHMYGSMIQWLRTCIELSEITRPMLHKRVLYWNAYLMVQRTILDNEVEKCLALERDPSNTMKSVERTHQNGRRKEAQYNIVLHLTKAIAIASRAHTTGPRSGSKNNIST